MDFYDAVIVLGGGSGFYKCHFVSDFGLDKLKAKGGQAEGYSSLWDNPMQDEQKDSNNSQGASQNG